MNQFFEKIAKGNTDFDVDTFSWEMAQEFFKIFKSTSLSADDYAEIIVRLIHKDILYDPFHIETEALLKGVNTCLIHLMKDDGNDFHIKFFRSNISDKVQKEKESYGSFNSIQQKEYLLGILLNILPDQTQKNKPSFEEKSKKVVIPAKAGIHP